MGFELRNYRTGINPINILFDFISSLDSASSLQCTGTIFIVNPEKGWEEVTMTKFELSTYSTKNKKKYCRTFRLTFYRFCVSALRWMVLYFYRPMTGRKGKLILV